MSETKELDSIFQQIFQSRKASIGALQNTYTPQLDVAGVHIAADELKELKAMAKQVGEENTNLINTIHAQRVELDETRSVINEALDLLETPEAMQGRISQAYRKLVVVFRKYPEG